MKVDAYTYTQKRIFAEHWAREPENPFKAALAALGDSGRAMNCWRELAEDDEVIKIRDQTMTGTEAPDGVPTKTDVSRLLWEMACQKALNGKHCYDGETRLKALAKLADLHGYNAPKTPEVQVNVQQNNVMMIPAPQQVGEWEAGARKRQQQLIEHCDD